MTFSQYAGVAIVPTLARIVLAAVFIPAGWNKVFVNAEFTADEANELRALGVTPDPAPAKTTADASGALEGASVRYVLARYNPQEPPPGTGTGDAKSSSGQAATAPAPTTTAPIVLNPAPQTPPQEPLPPGTYTAQALHKLTLMLHANNFPYPLWQARLAAFTELIGGAMLLLGLFSRIWGLGLSIAMGVAFYLTSMSANHIFQTDPRVFAMDPMKGMVAYIQASMFVLAFGVLLTGAGPLSLDRMLFGSGDEVDPGDAKID